MPADQPVSMLVCRFVAAVLERTLDLSDDAAYQRAVQAFVNELRPWMPPIIGRARPHAPLLPVWRSKKKLARYRSNLRPKGSPVSAAGCTVKGSIPSSVRPEAGSGMMTQSNVFLTRNDVPPTVNSSPFSWLYVAKRSLLLW